VKTVAECSSLDEAMLLRSLLDDSGIQATVPEELTVTYLGQTGGFRLQVADEDAETAAGIIAEAGK
jgi:hypothetical protein